MNFQNDSLSEYLQKNGLKRISQGKVRDTYYLDDERLLVVASDRISVFDFVLNASIPKKGEVLTALTHFWLTKIIPFENHLIPSRWKEIGFTENAASDLREDGLLELPLERFWW